MIKKKLPNFLTENQLGMELNRTDGVEDPMEGTNVTLSCRTYIYTRFSSLPKWLYQINGNGKMKIIDESNPPEGCKPLLIFRRLNLTPVLNLIFRY
jgi:hypothetical protein